MNQHNDACCTKLLYYVRRWESATGRHNALIEVRSGKAAPHLLFRKGKKGKSMANENCRVFNASCAAGLEQLVAGEVESYGGKDISLAKGVVTWRGDISSGYRACLWSRYSSRVFLQIAEFPAPDNDSIYKYCSEIDWDTHLDCSTTFAVDCTLSEKSAITHSKFASLRVKDALVDQFRTGTGQRPSVQTDRPGLQINLHVHGDRAVLAIDLSGRACTGAATGQRRALPR